MTGEFSVNYDLQLNPNACKRCKACGLYLNQDPALDSRVQADIFWVGLSAVQFGIHEERIPLAADTRSGGLIEQAELGLRADFSFYRTNIVKCLPLTAGKIRYPAEHEMSKCFPNFEEELKNLQPSVVFLLGKQVATFVLKKYGIKTIAFSESFDFPAFYVGTTCFVPIQHPSYILVYKRKLIPDYIAAIHKTVKNALALS